MSAGRAFKKRGNVPTAEFSDVELFSTKWIPRKAGAVDIWELLRALQKPQPGELGPASTCDGCGHIETKGASKCANCGSKSFTPYYPPSSPAAIPRQRDPSAERPEPSEPVSYPHTPTPIVASRGKDNCDRCGSKVEEPEESSYCKGCEKYLGLSD